MMLLPLLNQAKIVDNIMHHNQTKYPGQRVMIVDINDYICCALCQRCKWQYFFENNNPKQEVDETK